MAHSRPKMRGAPRLRLYPVQFQRVSMQEAVLAKDRMHGRLACGRPLIVRLASEKNPTETPDTPKSAGEAAKKTVVSGNSSGNVNRNSKIAAIKNKLKALEEDNGGAKKQKRSD